MRLVSPFAASQAVIWDLHESYHMLISSSIFGNWSWQDYYTLEKSSLFLWAPLSSAMRTESLQFPSFPQHWCGQAFGVVLQLDKGCTARPPAWRLAEAFPHLLASWNCMAEWWKGAESHITHWAGGQLTVKALKMAFFPPIASSPPAQEPSPGHLRGLHHQMQRSAVPAPATLHPRGNLERNHKLHARDTHLHKV